MYLPPAPFFWVDLAEKIYFIRGRWQGTFPLASEYITLSSHLCIKLMLLALAKLPREGVSWETAIILNDDANVLGDEATI